MTPIKPDPLRYEHADMPEDDDLHGFVDGKFIPVSFVDGKLVPRVDRPSDPKPVKRLP